MTATRQADNATTTRAAGRHSAHLSSARQLHSGDAGCRLSYTKACSTQLGVQNTTAMLVIPLCPPSRQLLPGRHNAQQARLPSSPVESFVTSRTCLLEIFSATPGSLPIPGIFRHSAEHAQLRCAIRPATPAPQSACTSPDRVPGRATCPNLEAPVRHIAGQGLPPTREQNNRYAFSTPALTIALTAPQ